MGKLFARLDQSPILLAAAVLISTVAGRHADMGLSQGQQRIVEGFGREILLFAAVFLAVRNILLAILAVVSYVILVDYLLNEESRFCIIPGLRSDPDTGPSPEVLPMESPSPWPRS